MHQNATSAPYYNVNFVWECFGPIKKASNLLNDFETDFEVE